MAYSDRVRKSFDVLASRKYSRNVAADGFVWTPNDFGDVGSTREVYDQSHGRGPYRGGDKGGHFFLHKKETLSYQQPAVSGTNFRGNLFPNFQTGWTWSPEFEYTSLSAMNARGATAISRTSPQDPSFNVLGVLAETLQGIPKIIGHTLEEATSLFKKLGDEYLNVSFGWLPFVNDVKTFSQTIGNSTEIVNRYVGASGEHIRRRYEWPPIRTVRTAAGVGYAGDPLCNIFVSSDATEIITDKWSFSGAFRYYVPMDSRVRKAFNDHAGYSSALLSAELTPEVLWDLAPWSWAVDWFTNAGDVMNNISNIGKDGLVMQYGYIMRERTMERLFKQTLATTQFGIPAGTTCSFHSLRTMKERRAANPYGFGIDDTSLSTAQLAILSALGLSKGAR